jgi:hypothetical protein
LHSRKSRSASDCCVIPSITSSPPRASQTIPVPQTSVLAPNLCWNHQSTSCSACAHPKLLVAIAWIRCVFFYLSSLALFFLSCSPFLPSCMTLAPTATSKQIIFQCHLKTILLAWPIGRLLVNLLAWLTICLQCCPASLHLPIELMHLLIAPSSPACRC